MKTATILLTLTSPIVFALPTQLQPRAVAAQEVDRLLFQVTLQAFKAARDAQSPTDLDWTTDGCSSVPNNPMGWDFASACYRHDFGYRNGKAQARFTDTFKDKVDEKFKTDLLHQCTLEGDDLLGTCRGLAELYYTGVHAFANKKRSILEEEVVAEETNKE